MVFVLGLIIGLVAGIGIGYIVGWLICESKPHRIEARKKAP